MARTKIDFDTVRTIGLALPGVEEGTAWGTPALKVHGKMFACIPSHKSAEPNSLAVRIDFDQRDELIVADPRTYYVKEHYVGYACVLVRLAHVHPDALRDLLRSAWRFVSNSKSRVAPRRKRSPASPARSPTDRSPRRSRR